VTDPNSAASKAIVEYTWGKIWNAKAYNACSNMPRAGHMGMLNERRCKHVVALLLDPASRPLTSNHTARLRAGLCFVPSIS
jgi:sulfur-oxidizing protein SoxX